MPTKPCWSFYVKFEEWNQGKHATPKLIPSYGGWAKFRSVLLDAWNMDNFMQIGDASNGFIDVARETKDMIENIEASIRIKDNYFAFILAFVCLFDKKGKAILFKSLFRPKGNDILKEI